MGNLLESNAQTLVNTVNCVGVMGKGIALDFKKRFPAMFDEYVEKCARGEVRLGEPYLWKNPKGPWVLNFPTKDHWRSNANLRDIVRGLNFLIAHYEEWGIESLAVPPLGCGNGQLEWRMVGPILTQYLERLDIPVDLYAPYGTPQQEMLPSFLEKGVGSDLRTTPRQDFEWISPAWIALVEVLRRLEAQPYHWPVGRTVFQKLAYVATALGLPTDLEFTRGSYGPYSADLKKLEARLESHGLVSERSFHNMIQIRVGPAYLSASKTYEEDLAEWEPIIHKLFDLFMRISTANQAELVASALFSAEHLAKESSPPTERMIFDYVAEWKKRRRPAIDETDLAVTIRDLASRGWLNATRSNDLPACEEWAS